MKPLRNLLILVIGVTMTSCTDYLEEEAISQLAPDNFLTTEVGLKSLLYSSYSNWYSTTVQNRNVIGAQEFGTDQIWQTGGGENRDAVQIQDFTLGPETIIYNQIWDRNYAAIRDANLLLDYIDDADISQETNFLFKSEARFIRAISYYRLYLAFGPVPLRTSTLQELELSKASDEEMQSFIERELLEIVDVLPLPGNEPETRRAHKGAALGYLTKFYLNTKQWQKCSDAAKSLIDLGVYELFISYEDLFKVENEDNKEYIWVIELQASPIIRASAPMAVVFPSDFAKDPRTGLEWNPLWRTVASTYRILDGFYNSFESGDERRNLILSEYINFDGDTISLLNEDNTRPFKYWPHEDDIDTQYGADLPQIRYADILLARAEALNEINGTNQESINLINLVRARAGLADVGLNDFTTKDALRDHILDERGWEFYFEAKRRYDLIRMGKFIEFAQNRGKTNAQPFHVKFPIPQYAIDSNPLLEQNEGY